MRQMSDRGLGVRKQGGIWRTREIDCDDAQRRLHVSHGVDKPSRSDDRLELTRYGSMNRSSDREPAREERKSEGIR